MQQSSFYKGLDGIKSLKYFLKGQYDMIVVESSHFTEIFIKLAVKNPNLNIRLEMNSGLPNNSRVLSSF